jgi:hypothetical protein
LIAVYDRRVPGLRGPGNSLNTGLKTAIIGYVAGMFAIGVNELWHFWFVEEIFAVPPHWIFNVGIFVALIESRAYLVRVYHPRTNILQRCTSWPWRADSTAGQSPRKQAATSPPDHPPHFVSPIDLGRPQVHLSVSDPIPIITLGVF